MSKQLSRSSNRNAVAEEEESLQPTQVVQKNSSRSEQQSQSDQEEEDETQVRRKLRAKYRKLIEQTEEKKLDLILPNSDGLASVLTKSNQLYAKVKEPREGALDSEFLTLASHLGVESTAKVHAGFKSRDLQEYIAKVRIVLRGSDASLEDHYQNTENQRLNEIDWASFGKKFAMKYIRRTPTVNFIYGTLGITAKPKKERVVRTKEKEKLSEKVTADQVATFQIQNHWSEIVQPKLVLQVLPKLLNSTVVTFMNGTTHTSERALHGYFSFHRLFIWAIEEYPSLLPEINQTIKSFISVPQERLKKNTPNVGEWLALLLVSSATWKEAAQAYLEENFDRNVMWYLKENGSLINTEDPSVNSKRLDETFRLTKVSRNLLAFQVLFLDVARPKGMDLKQVAERYDANYGMPSKEMEQDMKEVVKKINSMKNYKEWFEIIKVDYPGDEKFKNILCQSVRNAATKDGYSNNRGGGGGSNRGRGRGRY